MYERIRGALTSDGTHGITRVHYLKLSTGDKSLPSLNTLVTRVSPRWDNILAFFKLSPPLPDACRSQCPHCGEFIAGGKVAEHQEHCQQQRTTKRSEPKPAPVEAAPVACVIAPAQEREVSLPIPRIVPTFNKWAGVKGYDPTWKAPTGDTQRLVLVQPGEQTCLKCGDTFAAGGYCIHCGEGAINAPSVPTAAYLRPEEYRIGH